MSANQYSEGTETAETGEAIESAGEAAENRARFELRWCRSSVSSTRPHSG